MAREQRYFWTVENCARVTATEVCGRLPQADIAASNRDDPWLGCGSLILGATRVTYVATACRFGGGRFWFLCPGWGRLHRSFRASYDVQALLKRQGPNPKRVHRLLAHTRGLAAHAQEPKRMVHGLLRRPL